MTTPDVKMEIAKLDGRMVSFGTGEAHLLLDVAKRLADDGFPALAAEYVGRARAAMDVEELWQPSLQRLLNFQREFQAQRKPLYATDIYNWLTEHGWTPPANPNDLLKD